MLNFQNMFHIGILVPNLDSAMAELGTALGLTWCTPYVMEGGRIWTPQFGMQTVPLRVTFSRAGPQRVELLEGSPGSFWDGHAAPGLHHFSVFADDVFHEVSQLLREGWTVVGADEGPERGYGNHAYMRPDTGGVMIEIMTKKFVPMFEAWWSGEPLKASAQ